MGKAPAGLHSPKPNPYGGEGNYGDNVLERCGVEGKGAEIPAGLE